MTFQTWFLQTSSKPRRCLQTGLLAPNNPSLKLMAWLLGLLDLSSSLLLLILTCWLQRTMGWGLGLNGPSRRGTSSIEMAESWGKNRELCREHWAQSSGAPGCFSHTVTHATSGRPCRPREMPQPQSSGALGSASFIGAPCHPREMPERARSWRGTHTKTVSCDHGPAQRGWPSNNTLQPSLSFVTCFPRRNNRN